MAAAQSIKQHYTPKRRISESSEDTSGPSTTIVPVDGDEEDEEEASNGIIIQEIPGQIDDEEYIDDISICDALLGGDGRGHQDDSNNSWFVEDEDESATSTNGLLKNYPELRRQPGLDTMSWTTSDDYSSTTVSGTLSGTEVMLEGEETDDSTGRESSSRQHQLQQPSTSQCISQDSRSQSSSLRIAGLVDLGEEEDEVEDILVVDPTDQTAVLIVGGTTTTTSKRCSGLQPAAPPDLSEENVGQCVTKSSPKKC